MSVSLCVCRLLVGCVCDSPSSSCYRQESFAEPCGTTRQCVFVCVSGHVSVSGCQGVFRTKNQLARSFNSASVHCLIIARGDNVEASFFNILFWDIRFGNH